MKRLLLPLFTLLLFACNQNAQNNSIDEQSETNPKFSGATAYGELHLGATEDQFQQTFPSGTDTIGSVAYDVNVVMASSDSLAGLYFSGPIQSASEIETELKRQTDALIAAYSSKYGEPDKTNKYPTIMDLSSSLDYIIASWADNGKHVEVGITVERSSYQAYMKIYDDYLLSKVFDKAHEDKEKQAQKDGEKF